MQIIKNFSINQLVLLRRNPQFLSPKTMKALKQSIVENGFLVNLIVRPFGKKFEIISGNHRFLAGKEVGMREFPCIVVECKEQQAKVLAMNMNTIHGDPPAKLIAPFLSDLDDEFLKKISLPDLMLDEILKFDDELGAKLKSLSIPEAFDNETNNKTGGEVCKCTKCGKVHVRGNKDS